MPRHRVAWWGNCLRPVASPNLVCAAAAVRQNQFIKPPSGYAKPFRFVKEFGPDQVLRSDSESSRQIKRAFGSGESSFDLSLPNASSAIDLLLSSDCVTNRVQNIDEIARGLNFAEKRHSRQHLHLVVRDVVDASKLFVRSELFPGRTLCPLRFSSE